MPDCWKARIGWGLSVMASLGIGWGLSQGWENKEEGVVGDLGVGPHRSSAFWGLRLNLAHAILRAARRI